MNLGSCITEECDSCETTHPADLDFNGSVGIADLLLLLDLWGGSGAGDIDGNGVVEVGDLLELLAVWG